MGARSRRGHALKEKWTVARVWAVLASAEDTTHRAGDDEQGSIDGPALVRLCAQFIAEDEHAPPGLLRWMQLRARSETIPIRNGGPSITDHCRNLRVSRSTFGPRTHALALRLAAYLNDVESSD